MGPFIQFIIAVSTASLLAIAPGFHQTVFAQRGAPQPSRPDSPAVQAWLDLARCLRATTSITP